jgi:hypothetical protein
MAVLVVAAVGLIAVAGICFVLPPAGVGPPCNACGGPGFVMILGSPRETVVAGDSLYNFSVDSAETGLLWGDLALHLEAPGGGTIPLGGTAWNVTVLDLYGDAVAFLGVGAPHATWSSGGDAPVESGEWLRFVSPPATTLTGQGDCLVVTGAGSGGNAFEISVQIP